MECSYKYTENVPVHLVEKLSEDKDKPNFVIGTEWKKGLMVHGPQCGVLTEDKLNDAIVEYLIEKTDGEGNKIYAQYFEKKSKKGKKSE